MPYSLEEPLEFRTESGRLLQVHIEDVYDNLGIVVLELKAEDGSVFVLELEIREFRKAGD